MKDTCRRLLGKEISVTNQKLVWDMVPYDVQIVGAIALHRGSACEMATGEGKTLAATMPLYLNALAGRGAHLVTVNSYLAERDAQWMGAIYSFLGMEAGVIDLHQPGSLERRAAYRADITYGTNNEFGFDYLRDNMVHSLEGRVQPRHYYAIIDEVDSILIDEARTPLIISGPVSRTTDQSYKQYQPLVAKLYREQMQIANGLIAEAEKVLAGEGEGDESGNGGERTPTGSRLETSSRSSGEPRGTSASSSSSRTIPRYRRRSRRPRPTSCGRSGSTSWTRASSSRWTRRGTTSTSRTAGWIS